MQGIISVLSQEENAVLGFVQVSAKEKYPFRLTEKGAFQQGDPVNFTLSSSEDGSPLAVLCPVEDPLPPLEKAARIIEVFLQSVPYVDCASLAPALIKAGINYKESGTLERFLTENFPNRFLVVKQVEVDGKKYPLLLTLADSELAVQPQQAALKKLTDDQLQSACALLDAALTEKSFLDCSQIPHMLQSVSINYKDFTSNISRFLLEYFPPRYKIQKDVFINGKKHPSILVKLPEASEKPPQPIPVQEDPLQKLKALYQAGRYEDFLLSPEFASSSPASLGGGLTLAALNCVNRLIKGADAPEITLNSFQALLFSVPKAALLKQYKDDEKLLEQGARSSFGNLGIRKFEQVFSSVYFGTNSPNTSWASVTERFWSAQNQLAFLCSAVTLFVSKKEQVIADFIKESKKCSRIDGLSSLLSLWHRYLHPDPWELSVSLKRNIIGNCLDCRNLTELSSAIRQFDSLTLPTAASFPAWIENGDFSPPQLTSLFESELEAKASEKLIECLWQLHYNDDILPPTMMQVLSSVCLRYPIGNFEEILFAEAAPAFGKKRKEAILRSSFESILNAVAEYRASYVLANYIYNQFAPDTPEGEKARELWLPLREKMMREVKSLIETTPKSYTALSLFKLDPEAQEEAQNFYCKAVLEPRLSQCESQEELGLLTKEYEEAGQNFAVHYLLSQAESAPMGSPQKYVNLLIETGRFQEAVRYVKQQRLSVEESKKQLRRILCGNFKAHGLNEAAFALFDDRFSEQMAEALLLEGFLPTEDGAVLALLSLYAHQKEWLKLCYLYAPVIHIRLAGNQSFFEALKALMRENGLAPEHLCRNHFNVMKAAIQALSPEEFDRFLSWAQRIPIPYNAKNYQPNLENFSKNLKEFLSDGPSRANWDRLLATILKSDNREALDYFRYTVIAFYLGRFGEEGFHAVVRQLSQYHGVAKDYSGYYNSMWRGLLSGRYGINFIAINIPLVENCPLTYWNLFYDTAVLQNHLFEGYEYNNAALNPKAQIPYQEFYDALLDQYFKSRENVFLKIAAQLLKSCPVELKPSFEKFLPYCGSQKEKDFLFQMMIRLIREGRYLSALRSFINGEWNCVPQEEALLALLKGLLENAPIAGMPELDEGLWDNFREDCLSLLTSYPEPAFLPVLNRESKPMYYRCLVLCHIVPITYNQQFLNYMRQEGGFSEIHHPAELLEKGSTLELRFYLEFWSECYKRQLKTNVSFGLEYLERRYSKMLIVKALSSEQLLPPDDSDIIDCMQKNRHYTLMFERHYQKLRTALFSILTASEADRRQKALILWGLFADEWDSLLPSLAPLSQEILSPLGDAIRCMNYRSFHTSLLGYYLKERDICYSLEEISPLQVISPKAFRVLCQLRQLKENNCPDLEEIKKRLGFICRLDPEVTVRRSFDSFEMAMRSTSMWENYREIFLLSFVLTFFDYDIVKRLAKKVRNPQQESKDFLQNWLLVFQEIDALPVYHYLYSLKYALSGDRERSRQAFAQIGDLSALPREWGQEQKELSDYLKGQAQRLILKDAVYSLDSLTEKAPSAISFLEEAKKDASARVSAKSALEAYKSAVRSQEEVQRAAAYKKLFCYTDDPSLLYSLYSSIEEENIPKLTYNEALLDYGILLATEKSGSRSPDRKLDILIELFDIYRLLSEVNQGKEQIVSRLTFAVETVLGTPGVTFSHYLSRWEEIQKILSQEMIRFQPEACRELSAAVEEAKSAYSRFDTEMDRLQWILPWRQSKNFGAQSSDYLNAFRQAADEEISRLQSGPNLSLTLQNTLIEDDCIFFEIGNTGRQTVLLGDGSQDSIGLGTRFSLDHQPYLSYENQGFSQSQVELRPGDLCGQACRIHPAVLQHLKEGKSAKIILSILWGEKVLCSCGASLSLSTQEGTLLKNRVSSRTRYLYDFPAFTDSIEGFGRKGEQAQIRELLKSRLMVLYGPSRVGKSSLLSYLKNHYLPACCKEENRLIAAVSVADERNKDDYQVNLLSPGEPVPYDDPKAMLEYLFIAPLLAAFGGAQSLRRCRYGTAPFPESLKEEILSILRQPGEVKDRYAALSQLLEANNSQIWLLFDEFQQAVENWQGTARGIAELCDEVKHYIPNIRLVFCGSDGLVRILECRQDQNWNEFKISTSGSLLPVSQLQREDFAEMMKDPRIWGEGGCPLTDDAMELLFQYTGGNAICGKIFGNRLLDRLNRGDFENRRFLYPADVSEAAFALLGQKTGNELIDLNIHTTKNLDEELKYLLFIAGELSQHRDYTGVAREDIRAFFSSRQPEEIDLSLKVLVARGILTEREESYRFATMFYYDFFKSKATFDALDALRRQEQPEEAPEEEELPPIRKLLDQVEQLVDEDSRNWKPVRDTLFGMYQDHPENIDSLRRLLGDNITTQNRAETISTVNNIQINYVQNITNAFTSILNGENLLDAYQKLPQLDHYIHSCLPAEGQQRLDELPQLISQCGDPQARELLLAEQAQIQLPAEEKLCSDYAHAIINAGDSLTEDISETAIASLLQIQPDELAELKQMPSEFLLQFQFATVLHSIFDKMEQASQQKEADIDYCPVAIMYCKLVEAMLKKLHLRLYIAALPDHTITRGSPITFGQLTKKKTLSKNKGKLSIGSFSYPIVTIDRKDPANSKVIEEGIQALCGGSAKARREWRAHAAALATIQLCRNKSAHELTRVTRQEFVQLIRTLFSEGELLRIQELKQSEEAV